MSSKLAPIVSQILSGPTELIGSYLHENYLIATYGHFVQLHEIESQTLLQSWSSMANFSFTTGAIVLIPSHGTSLDIDDCGFAAVESGKTLCRWSRSCKRFDDQNMIRQSFDQPITALHSLSHSNAIIAITVTGELRFNDATTTQPIILSNSSLAALSTLVIGEDAVLHDSALLPRDRDSSLLFLMRCTPIGAFLDILLLESSNSLTATTVCTSSQTLKVSHLQRFTVVGELLERMTVTKTTSLPVAVVAARSSRRGKTVTTVSHAVSTPILLCAMPSLAASCSGDTMVITLMWPRGGWQLYRLPVHPEGPSTVRPHWTRPLAGYSFDMLKSTSVAVHFPSMHCAVVAGAAADHADGALRVSVWDVENGTVLSDTTQSMPTLGDVVNAEPNAKTAKRSKIIPSVSAVVPLVDSIHVVPCSPASSFRSEVPIIAVTRVCFANARSVFRVQLEGGSMTNMPSLAQLMGSARLARPLVTVEYTASIENTTLVVATNVKRYLRRLSASPVLVCDATLWPVHMASNQVKLQGFIQLLTDTKATPNFATFAPVFEEACKLMISTRGAGSSGSVDEVDTANSCYSWSFVVRVAERIVQSQSDDLWPCLSKLIRSGQLSVSAVPEMLSTLLVQKQLGLLRECLVYLSDVSEVHLVSILDAILDDNTSTNTTGGHVELASVCEELVALVVSATRNDAFLVQALCALSHERVLCMVQWLSQWLDRFAQFNTPQLASEYPHWTRVPTFSQVIEWLNLLLDSHFSSLVTSMAVDPLVLKSFTKLRSFTNNQMLICDRVGSLDGLLKQSSKKRVYSKISGASISDYCIEMLKL